MLVIGFLIGLTSAALGFAYITVRNSRKAIQQAQATAAATVRSQLEQELERRVAEQTASLEASQTELQTILDRVLAVILKLRLYPDQTVRYELISHRCAEFFGYTADELIANVEREGRNVLWRSRIHPDDLDNVVDPAIASATQDPNSAEQCVEYRFYRKDDSLCWILSHMLFAWNDAGQYWNVTIVETDITERKQAEQEQQESEKRFQTIAQVISQLFFVRSETGQFLYVSPAYETIWGRTCESLYADSSSWMEAIHPDDRLIISQSVSQQFQHTSDSITREYRIIRPDGEVRWIFAQVKQVSDDVGNTKSFVGFAADISDRKQVEIQLQKAVVEKEALLQEIQHRVKNNLQLIISMLNMQQRRVTHPETLEKLRDSNSRIRVISLVHDLLQQSDSQAEVNLTRYVSVLIRQFSATHEVSSSALSFDLHLQPVVVSSKVASICGLMLNELLTNILKYAFPDGDRPEPNLASIDSDSVSLSPKSLDSFRLLHPPKITIRISESPSDDSDVPIVHLVVADNGIGLPDTFDINANQNLGLLLVRSFVEQLNGTVTLDTHLGTQFQIRFPNR